MESLKNLIGLEFFDSVRGHKQIYSVDKIVWAPSSSQQAIITLEGTTFTPGWTHFILVPSMSNTSSPLHIHLDAWGMPPSGDVKQIDTPVTFEHFLPAGNYYVTVHAFTGATSFHIDCLPSHGVDHDPFLTDSQAIKERQIEAQEAAALHAGDHPPLPAPHFATHPQAPAKPRPKHLAPAGQ